MTTDQPQDTRLIALKRIQAIAEHYRDSAEHIGQCDYIGVADHFSDLLDDIAKLAAYAIDTIEDTP